MAVRTRKHTLNFAAVILLSIGLLGCMQTGRPVVADRSSAGGGINTEVVQRSSNGERLYTVRKGDTLYSIAWRYELDYKGFARANTIPRPYVIKPGQRLRLASQAAPRVPKRTSRPTSKKPTIASVPQPAPKAAPKSAPKPTPKMPQQKRRNVSVSGVGSWVWPVKARPSTEFSSRNKGMDFEMRAAKAAPVNAASAGEVVYAGNGIGGYERLVIIKHDSSLLSAYSFNGRMLVAEQDAVSTGQRVADIRDGGGTKPSLHFELRRDGEPINPRTKIR